MGHDNNNKHDGVLYRLPKLRRSARRAVRAERGGCYLEEGAGWGPTSECRDDKLDFTELNRDLKTQLKTC